jgi:lipoteichoic acid synthase
MGRTDSSAGDNELNNIYEDKSSECVDIKDMPDTPVRENLMEGLVYRKPAEIKPVEKLPRVHQIIDGVETASVWKPDASGVADNLLETDIYVIKDVGENKKAATHKKEILHNNRLVNYICQSPFNTVIYFIIIAVYMELIFHGYNFKLNDGNTGHIIWLAVAAGIGCSVLTNLLPTIVNKIIYVVISLVISFLYICQLIYHEVFNNYFSIAGTIEYGNQAADNAETVLRNIRENIWLVLLLLIPVILSVVVLLTRTFDFKRRSWYVNLALAAVTVIIYASCIWTMKLSGDQLYSPYEIYSQYTSIDMAVEKLGVWESYVVDIREGIKRRLDTDNDSVAFLTVNKDKEADENMTDDADLQNNVSESEVSAQEGVTTDILEEASVTEASTEEAAPEPNVLDIDFDEIEAENSDSDGVIALCEYFSSLEPTYKNEYTGMFEGKNLIWITAEGFSGYVLNSGLFPTLTRMSEKGFKFTNYYSPLWYGSTLGGEYANLLGSMPQNGGYLSLSRAGSMGNDLAFSIANQLKRLGYTTYAYHDNEYTYYDRNISHPLLGYTWIANGSGLDAQVNEYGNTPWPQSDLVMVDDTFDEYVDETPFHIYYLTVSGHVEYNFAGNAMSAKNKDVVEKLSYDETTKAYIAAQYELELAVEELINKLEEAGILDDTVIVLAGDHVPYDNMEVLDSLAGYELEDNFEAYKSTMIIWSSSMEEPVKVDKVCSSIDILPTVSNLFGLEYDSRLIIGQDILSDSEGLVMFNNRSFITDKYYYNSTDGTITGRNGYKAEDEEVENMKSYVADKFTAADSITQYDFYKYIEDYR